MEFARRIGDLAQLTRRLDRVQAEKVRVQGVLASSRFTPPSTAFSSLNDEKTVDADVVNGPLSLTRRHQRTSALANRDAQTRVARAQDQLLLRRLPVAVSLVERSWCKLDRKKLQRGEKKHQQLHEPTYSESSVESASVNQDVLSTAVFNTSTAPSQLVRAPVSSTVVGSASQQQMEAVHFLLQLLHTIEQARRQHLQEKEHAARYRCELTNTMWQKFQKEFGSQLRPRRQHAKNRSNNALSAEDEQLLKQTADALQRRRRAAYDDLALLRASLLTRPFVSARLWRLLLREPVWMAAVAEHKCAAAAVSAAGTSHNNTSRANQPSITRLLSFCLALTRITMGILRDYVQGGQLSRHAPRFVVSLPSRIFRARMAGPENETKTTRWNYGVDEVHHETLSEHSCVAESAPKPAEGHEDSDVLLDMLQNAEETSLSPTSSAVSSTAEQHASCKAPRKKRNGREPFKMRWIPPHTAEVLPLVTDTLALHSFILPELDLPVLLQHGCAPELVSLCATLQHLASTTLALKPSNVTDKSSSNRPALRRTLHLLEQALTDVGSAVVAHLVAECQAPVQEERGLTAGGRSPRPPEEAARLAVQLHNLHLLPTGDAGVEVLLTRLLTDIFPELRTHTSRVLHEKARQSSLLAFATRPHRQKLYQRHGRKHAEKFLLETVLQQARLQQRQLAAALREQHLTEVHVRTLRELGRRLSPSDLLQLFQLYARHAADGSMSNINNRRKVADQASSAKMDVWMTGCLFLAETILLTTNIQQGSADVYTHTMAELATLWGATALLFPHIRARRAHQVPRQRAAAPDRLRAPIAAHTETLVWATLAEHVLTSINAGLAQRLQYLEEQRQSESTSMRRGGAQTNRQRDPTRERAAEQSLVGENISISSVVTLVAGVLEYTGHDEALRELTDKSNGNSGGGRAVEGSHANTHTPASLQPVQQSVRLLSRLLHELVLHDRSLWHQVRRLPALQRDAVEQQLRECFHMLGMLDNSTTRALTGLNREDVVVG